MEAAAASEVHCSCTSSLLGSGGAAASNSDERVDNVDGEVAADDQGREGRVVLCL